MTEQSRVSTTPKSVADVLVALDDTSAALPRRLRQCAEFTRRHLHLIAVSTVSDMARACDVAPSVYMRFCQAIGFSGYSEMQALFRARYTEFRPDYDERLANLSQAGGVATGRLLAEFAEAGHKSLLTLSNTTMTTRVDAIARRMAQAPVIHLVGLRRAYAVVNNMSYLLDKLRIPAVLHAATGQLVSASAIHSDDVMFAVTFVPFSPETIDLARTAHGAGAAVFGLTDSESCPVAGIAEDMLIAREDEVGGFRSLNAAITLTTALCVAISAKREES